jgi:hypothetical protein
MRVGSRFEVAALSAVVQNREAESVGLKQGALAEPRGPFLSRRWTQPKTRKRKCFAEDREGFVAGIVVGIEAEKRSCRRRFRI